MADIALTAANIRPLTSHGAIVLPGVAAATVTVGSLVYETSTGWAHADGNVSTTLAKSQGVCVASYDGETSIAAGNALSVCVFGPVSGYTSLTAGANYYLSDTVGRIGDAVGTFDRIVGFGVKLAGEVCLFVSTQQNDPSSA